MYFFTATINSWKPLLADDRLKQVVLNSIAWLAAENRAYTHAFVIMPNHIHILWSCNNGHEMPAIENALLKFTAHEFKKYLLANNPNVLQEYTSTQNDRLFHFWERRSRTIEIKGRNIAEQKLHYMHNNPLQKKWQLADLPETYLFSSASFYLSGKKHHGFLSHYADYI